MHPVGCPNNNMSYTKLIYHIVFRPHGNRPVIVEDHERDLYMYILGFCRNHQCVLYRIGAMPDHTYTSASACIPPSLSPRLFTT